MAVFDAVESLGELVYAEAGLFAQETPVAYSSGLRLPSLGVAAFGATSKEPWYLVSASDTPIRVRPVEQRQGGVLYAVDQMNNPDSIALKPGGIYKDECVVAGQMATTSTTSSGLALYQRFSSSIRRTFERIQSYWVGPEAMSLWRGGMRLTIGVDASRQLDLKP